MAPQRKISHKIADIVIFSVKRNLSEKRMREVFTNSSSSVPLIEGMDDDNTQIIIKMWIDSIVEHISSRQDSLTSDYVLDLIEKVQDYLEKNYTKDQLLTIAAFFENEDCKKIWQDNNLLEIIATCKDELSNSVMALMQSDECMDIMQKKLNSFMLHGNYDDNIRGSD
jgi:hypothetical protein